MPSRLQRALAVDSGESEMFKIVNFLKRAVKKKTSL